MGKEINLLINYPKSKRNLTKRKLEKDKLTRQIARKFDKDFFDGDRKFGYGGYYYNKKFWKNVLPTFANYWNLNSKSTLLDVGCGKGFMLYDLKRYIKGINVMGLDISTYAINNSLEDIKSNLIIGNATNLPFSDNSFDVVVSINTIHNLNKKDCAIALKEIQRVTKKYSFITVDAYRNNEEKKRMLKMEFNS